ncbi:MAG: arginine--tRNA ligase [Bacilli bacterium]|nr:arginine--tRNA ligase [Bacilli bacterium]
MILEIKEQLKKELEAVLTKLNIAAEVIIENPKEQSLGDVAVPCFRYAQILKENPNIIATKIKENFSSDLIEKAEVKNGYLNLFLNKKNITSQVLKKVIEENNNFGNQKIGLNKNIVIDYSSPNIAKPFGVGHLRSTVIGNSIKKIFEKLGYNTYGINYLGDYGTQFGKIICAYKMWGIKDDVPPIEALRDLYVRFHKEAQTNPELEEKGREWFKKLEDKDEEALKIWEWCREVSLKNFMETYKLLGIEDFDSYDGEAFFADKMASVIEELNNKKLLEIDNGATLVRLGDDLPPALIKRSDGASLYITRDLAAVLYRKKKYNFDEIIYVVGNEQTLSFKQLKKVIDKMGYSWFNDIYHISFGMILQDGKRMSTRSGKTIDLHSVLLEAIGLAKEYIETKNPNIDNIDETSRKIGVGAVIFNDLKNYRTKDIDFNLDEILKFEGETAPYIQYTYARINSMLENINNIDINMNNININEYIWNIIIRLISFDEVLVNSRINYDPSLLAKYIIDLAQGYNKFYANEKIIVENNEETEFKLKLSKATSIVLKEGMRILGIEMPIRM